GIEKDQIAQELEDELKNAARDIQLWGEMEVVQASLKHPDSKQTQAFLDDQLKHQPKYDLIFAVDAQGRLAAVNTIAAAVLGEPYKSILPEIRESWLQTVLEGGTVQGTDWAQLTFVNQLYGRNQQNSPPENRYQVALAAPLAAHQSREALGVLVAILNSSNFQRILDGAEDRFKRLGLSTGHAFRYGSDGDTITAHKYRTEYGTSVTVDQHLPQLHERILRNPAGTFRYQWREGPKISALGSIRPGLGTPLNWYLGVGINESDI